MTDGRLALLCAIVWLTSWLLPWAGALSLLIWLLRQRPGVTLALLVLASYGGQAQAGGCYRPFVGYAGAGYGGYHAHVTPTYYYPQTYYKPIVLEVEVRRDRYYSLSDLYRDRMFLEMFDMLKDRRQNQVPPEPQAPAAQAPPRAGTPPPVAAQRPVGGKATAKAKEILATNCVGCHGKGNEKLDLSDPDAVSVTKRWAAFGMMASGDMPQPPSDLRKGDKLAELDKWKQEHAIKEEDIKAVYDGWVMAAALAKRP